MIDTLAEYAPNLKDVIVHRDVITPVDLETRYGLTGGHIFHGELSLDQMFTMRPVLGWARYRTPIAGLYLCGAGTHPGYGVSGPLGRKRRTRNPQGFLVARRLERAQATVSGLALELGRLSEEQNMSNVTRRDVLQGLFAASVAFEFGGVPRLVFAQGEVVVPFTDVPPPAPPAPGAPPPPVRFDPKNLTSFVVSNDEFFAVSHYGIPTVDASTYKLRITGLVERPLELPLAELQETAAHRARSRVRVLGQQQRPREPAGR